MKYTNSKKLPRDFFRNIYTLTSLCGQPVAQQYATSVSNDAIFLSKPLFYYKNCYVYHTGSVYAKYAWAINDYDGAADSDTRYLCGHADTIEDIIEDIESTLELRNY